MPGNGHGDGDVVTVETLHQEDEVSLLSVHSIHPSPDSITKLVRRLKALTYALIPIEVPAETLDDPTSRVITPQVISAYITAAGDFLEPLPYCLLRARREFMWDANHNPADYDENYGRAIACEVLARRVIHHSPPEKIHSMMSSRYAFREPDGDQSDTLSAIELAIDSHCTIFLSSTEAQQVVNDLWCGSLIKKHDAEHGLEFVPYKPDHGGLGFWSHFSPSRLTVPRYQNIFRITVWIFFLFAYSQAVREPLDKLSPNYRDFDKWETIMYVMALGFAFEDIEKIVKLLVYVSWRAIGFWNIISLVADLLLMAAFSLRIASIASSAEEQRWQLRIASFECLSFVAPLIWMKVVPIFDGYKFIGTMQICVARMLQESGIFFCLLALLGIGFLQGLYALEAADGKGADTTDVVNHLVQALLQAPNFETYQLNPAGLALYYLWNLTTVIILLNVLISLFASAYDDVVEDAPAEYLTYFADKTVGMIRAPDVYVYPAPFNLIETVLVAPWEYVIGQKTYARINQYIMTTLFIIPLTAIAVYEAELNPDKNKWMKEWLTHADQGDEDNPEYQDPEVDGQDAERGLKISKVPFKDLTAVFPDITHSSETVITREIRDVKQQLEELKRLLLEKSQA